MASLVKKYLVDTHYNLITTLVVAIRLLSTPDQLNKENIQYAGKLIDYFIQSSAKMFGDTFVVHVIHMMHHLPDDVRRFGALNSFSAFPFEDFNLKLNRNINSGYKPLQQMLRCYNEMIDVGMFSEMKMDCDKIK